jgi:hypothetical protein
MKAAIDLREARADMDKKLLQAQIRHGQEQQQQHLLRLEGSIHELHRGLAQMQAQQVSSATVLVRDQLPAPAASHMRIDAASEGNQLAAAQLEIQQLREQVVIQRRTQALDQHLQQSASAVDAPLSAPQKAIIPEQVLAPAPTQPPPILKPEPASAAEGKATQELKQEPPPLAQRGRPAAKIPAPHRQARAVIAAVQPKNGAEVSLPEGSANHVSEPQICTISCSCCDECLCISNPIISSSSLTRKPLVATRPTPSTLSSSGWVSGRGMVGDRLVV